MPMSNELHNRLMNAIPNVGIDVNIQDQTSERISVFLGQALDTIVSISGADKDVESFNITTTGTVPVVGNYLCLQENGHLTQFEIISVVAVIAPEYTIGVSIPVDHDYSPAAGCVLQNVDMDANGSIAPVTFKITPKGDYKWDITRMMVSMTLSSAGDDGLFGNLTALSNGQYFRKEDADATKNLFNIKDNSDFAVEGYDVSYAVRSGGGGTHGMRSRVTFAGQDKSGVVIRLDGSASESFTTVVRDDLSSLVKYRIKIQGHVVE